MADYDVFIIGTGSAGASAASVCAAAGMKTAVADRWPFGGTCSLRGCEPKRLLLHAAELVDASRKMKGKGISAPAEISWRDLIRYKNKIIKDIPEKTEKEFIDDEIDIFHGECSFSGRREIEVKGTGKVTAEKIIIAAGAEPAVIPVEGSGQMTTSDEFMDLEELPEKIIFVGGGYISFEFAHAAARAGSRGVILSDTDQPLRHFEPYLVNRVVEASRESGVEVMTGDPVEKIEKSGNACAVTTEKGKRYEGGLVVHGAGRVPALKSLGLDSAGVETDGKGIVINDNLQSVSNPAVYVCGDANGYGIPLDTVATAEGYAAGNHAAGKPAEKLDYGTVPSVVFTLPPLASVGLTEKAAEESGADLEVSRGLPENWFYMKRHGYRYLGYKIIKEKDSGRILGAHLLGYNSPEVINLFAQAIAAGITARELTGMTYSHPTLGDTTGYMF